MNFKTLVIVAFIATATIADDTFLVDSEFSRLLAETSSTQSSVCTADSACTTTVMGGLAGCCAQWSRQAYTTVGTPTSTSSSWTSLGSTGKFCTPLVIIGSDKWFAYNGAYYSATACTTTTTTAASAGTACTSGNNTACNTTNLETCTTFSWSNGTNSSSWAASSGTLGSYCQKWNNTDTYSSESSTHTITYTRVQSTTNNYFSGPLVISSSSTAYTKESFSTIVKAGFAMIAALMVFLYWWDIDQVNLLFFHINTLIITTFFLFYTAR